MRVKRVLGPSPFSQLLDGEVSLAVQCLGLCLVLMLLLQGLAGNPIVPAGEFVNNKLTAKATRQLQGVCVCVCA